MTPLLLVEDDTRLADLVGRYLAPHGFDVATARRGDEAVAAYRAHRPAVVVLDLMLPGRDGLAVCRDLRAFTTTPILMLTAREDDLDQILGLESGADDYVVKPVQPQVLLARLRALLRRPVRTHGERLVFDRLAIDRASRVVTLDGAALDFTSGEFEMLWLLASRAGQVLSRDDLLNGVRGVDFDGYDRSVDVCIGKLRRKLADDPRRPGRIKTVRGRGYLFAPA